MPRASCKQVHQMERSVHLRSHQKNHLKHHPGVRARCVAPGTIEATQTHTQKEPLQHTNSLASSARCDTRAERPSEVPWVPGRNLSDTSHWHLSYCSTRTLAQPLGHLLHSASSRAASQRTASRFSAWPFHTKQSCC